LYCTFPVGGVCQARGDGGDSCTGLGQGTCKNGLACDVLGECRHQPSEFGELCGTGVSCISSLGCSADIGGRCEERDVAGEVCSGAGQGSCQSGLVCDLDRHCRHDPPQLGEPCGLGVSCISSLGCSAEIGGVCEERDKAGEVCSGFGQGSCQSGLVCDALRVCRSDPPAVDQPCGIGVPCAADLFCQAGTGRCKRLKTVGEGCSAFNQCRPELSCEPCFSERCDYPLQCFPNSNEGAITEQQCLALYDPAVHQTARDLGLARTMTAGDGISAVIAESQGFGVAYEAGDRYGCFTELCVGVNLDISVSAFVSLGFYDRFDSIGGSDTAFVQEVGLPGDLVSFSTSQIFERRSLDPFDLGALTGTEDAFSIGVSPDPIPVSAGVYACETVLDTVIGGVGQPQAPVCGDGILDWNEGCDDGDLVSGDGCSSACTVEAACGDGGIDPGESCDDGNTASGDGCSAACKLEPRCGNGNITAGEGCDDGNTAGGDGCSPLCAIEPRCGNGLRESGEACDDGNLASGDGCSGVCAAEQPVVGDADGDRDVDRNDVSIAFGLRNAPASGCPACDLDGNGVISVADGRAMVLLCTRPKCATQ
jgi:cysteine-rich repeat protein